MTSLYSSRRPKDHPRFTPRRPSQLHISQPETETIKPVQRNTAFVWLLILFCVLTGIATAGFIQSTYVINYISNDGLNFGVISGHKDITSHVTKKITGIINSSIEYPMTENSVVNDTVSQAIVAMHQDFLRSAGNNSLPLSGKFDEVISYSTPHVDKNHLSIIIDDKFDTGTGSHKTSQAWTFDKQSGQALTLDDLVSDSDGGMSLLLNTVAKQLPKDTLGTKITKKTTSFVVQNSTTLALYLTAKSTTGPTGSIVVQLPTDKTLAPYLQGAVAQSLFDVPITQQTLATNGPDCNVKKCVALTFDDGPGQYTEKLLRILKKHHVNATFFLIGRQVASYADAVRHEVSDGNVVGNHTWDHPDLDVLSKAQMAQEIKSTNAVINKVTGHTPTLLRPPYGATGPALLAFTKRLGMSSIFWSVDTRDWADQNSALVCKRAIENTAAGSIILMHDIYLTSVDAVPCIIKSLTSHGFTLVSVPELLIKTRSGANYY